MRERDLTEEVKVYVVMVNNLVDDIELGIVPFRVIGCEGG